MNRIAGLIDSSATEQSLRPTPYEDTTRYPSKQWDLRTLIIVFPQSSRFRYLNLNTTLGLMGVPVIDRPDNLGSIHPSDAFDLQFCLEAGERAATYKDTFSVSESMELSSQDEGAFKLALDDRLNISGAWPDYEISYMQPEEELEISIKLKAAENFRRWAHVPSAYCHYTTFCSYRGSISWAGKKDNVSGVCLLDHGYGRRVPAFMGRISKPVSLFRYEVLQFGEKGHVICLDTAAIFKMPIRRTGLVSTAPGSPISHMGEYSEDILSWLETENAVGDLKSIPDVWRGKLEGSQGRFEFEAHRATDPRPVIGPGFTYGFDYEAKWSPRDGEEQNVSGRGYVEETRG